MYAMMPSAPCNSPAAPIPATTRPRMKTAELGAAAQSTEPTGIHIGRFVLRRWRCWKQFEITLEDEYGSKIHKFGVKQSIGIASNRLKGCQSNQIT